MWCGWYNNLMKYKRVHCIGIGGIGISAIARHHAARGAIVSGSDISESDLISALRDEGMTIHIGHEANNIPANVDLIIHTIAIDYENNPEYIEAQKRINLDNSTDISSRHVAVLSYAEALGELTKEMKTIAICGTHGKTTTTAMTYAALKQAGMSPTLIVGSLIDNEGKKTNYIKGKAEKNGEHYLVIEACEYKRSFLNYQSEYVLVTNIDEDHLDYYKDIHDIRNAFREFAHNINHMGCLIIHIPEEIVFTSKFTKSVAYIRYIFIIVQMIFIYVGYQYIF